MAGETVIPCRRNEALAAAGTDPRPSGPATGSFGVPPPFFEPLPDERPDALVGSES